MYQWRITSYFKKSVFVLFLKFNSSPISVKWQYHVLFWISVLLWTKFILDNKCTWSIDILNDIHNSHVFFFSPSLWGRSQNFLCCSHILHVLPGSKPIKWNKVKNLEVNKTDGVTYRYPTKIMHTTKSPIHSIRALFPSLTSFAHPLRHNGFRNTNCIRNNHLAELVGEQRRWEGEQESHLIDCVPKINVINNGWCIKMWQRAAIRTMWPLTSPHMSIFAHTLIFAYIFHCAALLPKPLMLHCQYYGGFIVVDKRGP